MDRELQAEESRSITSQQWAMSSNNPMLILRLTFIEICNTILYSDDEKEVINAYNYLFGIYKRHIIVGSFASLVSCFEDVIYKILNEEESGMYKKLHEKYTPFVKFLALLREQMTLNSINKKFINANVLSKDGYKAFPPEDLRRYLLMYNVETETDIKNEYLQTILHKIYENVSE